jgi:PHP family Zn ribbon phosphoesterase
MRTYRADLHIHTCLSPCGEMEMTPRAIVAAAERVRLDIIGVCDHNASVNCAALVAAARGCGLAVVAGIEVTSREEVHVLGLFDTPEAALDLQAHVQAHLPGENDPEVFGPQVVVDEHDEPVELCPHLLIGATTLSLSEVVEAIHVRGGCAIAAHVDRERFGLIGQLGFVPPSLPLDGLEYSPRVTRETAWDRFSEHGRWELVCGSDAHRLEEIGSGWTEFELERPELAEIRMALHGKAGRRVVA